MSKKASELKRPKKQFDIYSPPYFGGKWLGSTMADDPAKVVGRVLKTSLYAITEDFTKQYILLDFKVVDVKDSVCNTIFYGHQYGREYLRSLVKRGTNKIEYIFDVTTLDGFVLRVYPTVFTSSHTSSSKRKAVRSLMMKVVGETASKLTHDQLAQEMVLGKTASDIYNEVKKIVLPRHVGVVKSKVIKIGTLQHLTTAQTA
ncbi:MAG: 30S ribosomal protein S3ae [Candidatus Caldarchaeum sp.]|nr:30S ribosomal protein S3ae [Candidatus Caldarchaeum sp.]MDW7978334.1 30S ribosomal protein S3ae [Candidatus Caldarchaeum sp.]MDW8359415.1 30S ribosomal protein S3ae [Candidatus Caldarchaeum sp.]